MSISVVGCNRWSYVNTAILKITNRVMVFFFFPSVETAILRKKYLYIS